MKKVGRVKLSKACLGGLAPRNESRARHILLKLWQIWVHEVPGLRFGNKDIELWFKPAGVVQTGCDQADDSPLRIFRSLQARTAFRAEAAQIFPAARARRGTMLKLAFGDSERLKRNDHDRHVRAATEPLAIATMTVQHQKWFSDTFVSDFAANATAGNGKVHSQSSAANRTQGKRNFECSSLRSKLLALHLDHNQKLCTTEVRSSTEKG